MSAYNVMADGFTFLEAPRWHRGALWMSDFYSHRVLRLDGAGITTVCEVDAQPSGLGFTPDGELMVVSMLDRRLLKLVHGSLDLVADLSRFCDGVANDMVVDDKGRAYIGNDGQLSPLTPTVIVRCDPGGSCHVAATDVVVPNGSAITPNGRELLVAETFAARISAWDVAADGTLHSRRTWAEFGPTELQPDTSSAAAALEVLPDGICLNAAGQLWVADAKGGGVLCLRQGGRVVAHVDTSPYTAYAVALGGADGRTLFICAGPSLESIDRSGLAQSALLRARVDIPGCIGI
jgi:sugar lactone lactonase YvrE